MVKTLVGKSDNWRCICNDCWEPADVVIQDYATMARDNDRQLSVSDDETDFITSTYSPHRWSSNRYQPTSLPTQRTLSVEDEFNVTLSRPSAVFAPFSLLSAALYHQLHRITRIHAAKSAKVTSPVCDINVTSWPLRHRMLRERVANEIDYQVVLAGKHFLWRMQCWMVYKHSLLFSTCYITFCLPVDPFLFWTLDFSLGPSANMVFFFLRFRL